MLRKLSPTVVLTKQSFQTGVTKTFPPQPVQEGDLNPQNYPQTAVNKPLRF
jgi:hypothetical protein